jgi:hypothetical protein
VGGPDVGALLEQPAHPDVGEPVLLVGDRQQPQVAPRAEPAPGELRHRDGAGRHLVLHVDGAAAPQPPVVVDDGLERRVRPVAGVARHDVGVPDERQRLRARLVGRASLVGRVSLVGRACRDHPRHPCHQVGPVVLAGHQLALHAVAAQVVVQVLRAECLVAEARFACVRRVAADQVARDPDHLVVQ